MTNCLKVGIAKMEITPSSEWFIAGSMDPVPIDQVKDPLYAKVLAMYSGDARFILITLDILQLHVDLVRTMKKRIREMTGITSEDIAVCPSHTHFGPYTVPASIDVIASYVGEDISRSEIELRYYRYMEHLYQSTAEAVKRALADLDDCSMGMTQVLVQDVSHNRRVLKEDGCWNTWLLPRKDIAKYPAEGPIDPALQIVAFKNRKNQMKVVLYNFAVHLCNSAPRASISADFPGQVERILSDSGFPSTLAMFTPGACGNINGSASSEVIGDRVGHEMVRGLRTMSFQHANSLKYELEKIELVYRSVSDASSEDVRKKWPSAADQVLSRPNRQGAVEVVLTGIRIGELAIVFIPAEMFTELGMEIRKRSPFAHTIVVTMSEGYIGYVPTAEAFANGGYETFYGVAQHQPEAGNNLVNGSVRLLDQLHTD